MGSNNNFLLGFGKNSEGDSLWDDDHRGFSALCLWILRKDPWCPYERQFDSLQIGGILRSPLMGFDSNAWRLHSHALSRKLMTDASFASSFQMGTTSSPNHTQVFFFNHPDGLSIENQRMFADNLNANNSTIWNFVGSEFRQLRWFGHEWTYWSVEHSRPVLGCNGLLNLVYYQSIGNTRLVTDLGLLFVLVQSQCGPNKSGSDLQGYRIRGHRLPVVNASLARVCVCPLTELNQTKNILNMDSHILLHQYQKLVQICFRANFCTDCAFWFTIQSNMGIKTSE